MYLKKTHCVLWLKHSTFLKYFLFPQVLGNDLIQFDRIIHPNYSNTTMNVIFFKVCCINIF